ncbi:MAG: hypothetical protein Q9195_002048 [Heterodermia aff. obscurata]
MVYPSKSTHPQTQSIQCAWDINSKVARAIANNNRVVRHVHFAARVEVRYIEDVPDAEDVNSARYSHFTSRLNTNVRDYVMTLQFDDDSPEWLRKREIPSSLEITGEDEGAACDESIELEVNRVHAAWESKEKYLEAHYRLLREDAVTPLRSAVFEMRENPRMTEEDSFEQTAIYEKVFIVAFTFANAGIAARISFSTRRVGKKILWEQSKRLKTGTIVALTLPDDGFKTVCLVGVVAGRPLAGLQQNPPEIDIFFAAPDEIEIDPHQEWLMVESRNGFFESQRHTLLGLQKLAKESFPLAKYIVDLDDNVQPPRYLIDHPVKDLSSVFKEGNDDFQNVDILDAWPGNTSSDLDSSQIEALQRMLTKQLAIVQGPPGTGKTHVSVVALKTLHKNMKHGDPPIIIAAHTNHALDQLLRHVIPFEKAFIRLGSFTTDFENIAPRTLHEVKQLVKTPEIRGGARGPAKAKMRRLVSVMADILRPLMEGTLIPSEVFVQYGIITEAQRESLIEGTKGWLRSDPDKEPGDIELWLGKELRKANVSQSLHFFDLPTEEPDLEYEQLNEEEAEAKVDEENDVETLKGTCLRLNEPFTGNAGPYSPLNTEEKLKTQLEEQDLWKINHSYRGTIYCYMQRQVKLAIRDAFRHKAAEYSVLVKQLKIGRWEIEACFLEQAKIIGCTTTGLSKYRGLIASVKPKVIMIEEAAETLEAYVTSACMPSLEHLILVGDHEQLRGHLQCNELAGKPFYLDVSMFERLVRHSIGHTQLITQRRMIPEIRRLLMPFYENLQDHPSVRTRKSVPGMGGINTYFFMHEWLEDTDRLMSKVNILEADMIVGFINHLRFNGAKPEDITVLTYYNGQRKLILSRLRRHPNLQGNRFKVVTIDSYQGEENDIVLLSLVRSNRTKSIGFLAVINRLCVALSRARRGLYIFGNGPLLFHSSVRWFDVAKVMGENPRRMGWELPIICELHGNYEYIKHPEDFEGTSGGCKTPCREELLCGHICNLACHPNDRNAERATPSVKGSPFQRSHSSTDSGSRSHMRQSNQFPPHSSSSRSQLSQQEIGQSIQAYQAFSEGGHVEADNRIEAEKVEAAKLKAEKVKAEKAEADKKGITNANEQSGVATDAEALEKLRILDEETEAALFGDLLAPSPPKASPKKEEKAKMVRPGVFRWEETFVPGGISGGKEKEQEQNLLD